MNEYGAILEVDIGNSYFKWRLREGKKVLEKGSVLRVGELDYTSIFAEWFSSKTPKKVSIASVVKIETERFTTWCSQSLGLSPYVAKVSTHFAALVNGYERVEQMGVDRWLAMIAAYDELGRECLVVDIGSACTIDLVLADGHHVGGYIAPGLKLMKNALSRDTDSVKLTKLASDLSLEPGRTTELAVSAGLQSMLLGLVLHALDLF